MLRGGTTSADAELGVSATILRQMILCPLSQDAHPLRYSISLDQPSLEAQHAGATAIPASVDDPAHGAYDEVMHGAHPLHANRVGLAVHRKALTMGADSTPGQQGTPANAQTKRKLFVQVRLCAFSCLATWPCFLFARRWLPRATTKMGADR